jgi:hypothetical protein
MDNLEGLSPEFTKVMQLIDDEDAAEKMLDQLKEILGSDMNKDPDKPLVALLNVMDLTIWSSGLRRAICSDIGECPGEEARKIILYMALKITHATEEEVTEMFKTIELDEATHAKNNPEGPDDDFEDDDDVDLEAEADGK